MKCLQLILVLLLISITQTGCWNRVELTEKGFIMGVAIDQIKPGTIKFSVQLYKPGQKAGGQGGKQETTFFNIETKSESIFDAVRDITLQLGRKAQFSHMRVIIINEKTAKREDLISLLEFFYRDHESRLNTKVLISEGDASEFLKIKPLIEQTVTQQLNRMQEIGNVGTGKVPDVNLLELSQALKSQVPNIALPVASIKKDVVMLAGMAMVYKGKMIGTLRGKQTENVLILSDQFKSGVLQIPCGYVRKDKKNLTESVEILKVNTKLKPILKTDPLKVKVGVNISGNIGELKCTKFEKREDQVEFQKKAQKLVEERLMDTIRFTQKKRIDLIGLGNQIHRNNSKLWKIWKKDWDKRYSTAKFEVKVDFDIRNTLSIVGKPLSDK
ncbi:Ger(x)C family spore germination protein [Paenibacillus harenae]|nr:Ger(x)C family spore germination protein [Paenibacillus harenae]